MYILATQTKTDMLQQTCPPVREDAPRQTKQQLSFDYSQNLVMSPRGVQCQD